MADKNHKPKPISPKGATNPPNKVNQIQPKPIDPKATVVIRRIRENDEKKGSN